MMHGAWRKGNGEPNGGAEIWRGGGGVAFRRTRNRGEGGTDSRIANRGVGGTVQEVGRAEGW